MNCIEWNRKWSETIQTLGKQEIVHEIKTWKINEEYFPNLITTMENKISKYINFLVCFDNWYVEGLNTRLRKKEEKKTVGSMYK